MHFDSIGVPPISEMNKEFGSPENWQRETTFLWIHKMLTEYTDDIIVFEGQVNPDFIIQGFSQNKFKNYSIILIDANTDTMKQRLIKRKQPELYTKDMQNWLNFLRKQAGTLGAEIIDTSDLNKQEVVLTFEKLAQNKLKLNTT